MKTYLEIVLERIVTHENDVEPICVRNNRMYLVYPRKKLCPGWFYMIPVSQRREIKRKLKKLYFVLSENYTLMFALNHREYREFIENVWE
ncbi:MAG TPA: hypothetical protein PLN86_17475 [Candidatus Hydrogenedentes bacterium]|nr:hypothetical protein [Candidatus Hydrogenedentota bacterium]